MLSYPLFDKKISGRKNCFFAAAILAFFTASGLLFTGCQKTPLQVSDTGFYFDTVITVTLYKNTPTGFFSPKNTADDSAFREILEQCMELASHFETLFSPTIEGSDIWNINHSNGAPVTVSDDTAQVLQTAIDYAKSSNGLVDPTVGILSMLWNFGSENKSALPSQDAIGRALSHVNYQKVSINGNQVTLTDSDASIDLGFIAKGYIGDQMKEFLLGQGISSAIINLGGNVVTIGTKPDGSPFKVGIQKPFEKSGTSALVLELTDTSAVSAGNYERYFEKDGVLYHHILSTETGYPASSGLSQVTILSKSSTQADALSTLCFILGYEKAASLLEHMPDVKAVFIMEDGKILYVNF